MHVIERVLTFDDVTSIEDDNGVLAEPDASHDWAGGTTYAASALVVRDGYWWLSQQGSNTGNDPLNETDLDDPTWWGRVCAVAVRRPFDRAIRVALGEDPSIITDDVGQLTGPLVITFDNMTLTRPVNALRLEGIGGCSEVRAQVFNASGTEVYDRTVQTIDTGAVVNWTTWMLFTPVDYYRADALFWGVPGYKGYKLVVTLTGTNPSLGELHGGDAIFLGDTIWGTESGYDPYDRIERNAYGDARLVEQGVSDVVRFRFQFDLERKRFVRDIIKRNRIQVQAWIADPTLTQLGISVLGFPTDGIRFPLERRVKGGRKVVASLPIEGVSAG